MPQSFQEAIMNTPALPLCPACRQGHLHPQTTVREYRPRDVSVQVELLTSVCDACGVPTTRSAQHSENLRRMAARKVHYGGLLMGEEIAALRRRYGLTQQAASKVFGKGKIAFSRYENETSYPDDSTTLLLTLAIESPAVIKSLADKAGVTLPLWAERCEDEQQAKVHLLPTLIATQQRVQHSFVPVGSSSGTATAARKMPAMTFSRRSITVHEASNDAAASPQEALAS
jgi:HTH-type transcriptional regulator/antitoxin MqsA